MLLKRVITALWGIPLVFYLVYLGGVWYTLLVGLVALLGVFEFFILTRPGSNLIKLTALLAVVAVFVVFYVNSLEYMFYVLIGFLFINLLFLVFQFQQISF